MDARETNRESKKAQSEHTWHNAHNTAHVTSGIGGLQGPAASLLFLFSPLTLGSVVVVSLKLLPQKDWPVADTLAQGPEHIWMWVTPSPGPSPETRAWVVRHGSQSLLGGPKRPLVGYWRASQF